MSHPEHPRLTIAQSTPAHGSDVLRVWAAGVDYTRDNSIGPSSISAAAEQLRKLRSALRFMLGNTATAPSLSLSEVQLSLVSYWSQEMG
jgi:isoleucyl-tRNA synthetase